MKTNFSILLLLAAALMFGCADMGSPGGTRFGEVPAVVPGPNDREGNITAIEVIKADSSYRLGIGAAIGAIAGGLLGSQVGTGSTTNAATATGAIVGGAAGSVAESALQGKDAQRVTVQMRSGGQVTIMQPVDNRLSNGMNVLVTGSGENARVIAR